MLCNLLLVLTRVLTLFNGDMWYVIRGYEGGFNLLAWCWNLPMVVVTVQGAPHGFRVWARMDVGALYNL